MTGGAQECAADKTRMLKHVVATPIHFTAKRKLPKASTALPCASPAVLVLALGPLLLLARGGSALLPGVFLGARLQLLKHALVWGPILCKSRKVRLPISVHADDPTLAVITDAVLSSAYTTFSMTPVWHLILSTSALLSTSYTL